MQQTSAGLQPATLPYLAARRREVGGARGGHLFVVSATAENGLAAGRRFVEVTSSINTVNGADKPSPKGGLR